MTSSRRPSWRLTSAKTRPIEYAADHLPHVAGRCHATVRAIRWGSADLGTHEGLEAERLAAEARERSDRASAIRAERDEQLRLANLRDPDVRTDEDGYRIDDDGNRSTTATTTAGTTTAGTRPATPEDSGLLEG